MQSYPKYLPNLPSSKSYIISWKRNQYIVHKYIRKTKTKILIDPVCFQAKMQIRKALLLCGVLGMINYGFGCQMSEFMCDTGYCVALDKFCNGNDDCGDKSDEPPYCSRKFFESYVRNNAIRLLVNSKTKSV